MSITLLSWLAAVLYLSSALVLALPLLSRMQPPRLLGLALAWPAVLLHVIVVLSNLLHEGGLDLHFFAALSLVAVGVAGLCLIVNLLRPVAALGVIVFPLAALLLLTALTAPHMPLPIEWQIKLHVVFALLGYSVLCIAALLAIGLALQERALRLRQFSGLLRALPPLTLTEALMFQLIRAGFVLLSLTLLSGILFVHNLFDQHLVHKTVLSIAAWLVFGTLLWGRWRYGWRGRRAVQLTLWGMALLLLAYFGSQFVLEVVLKRVA
ncbi:inner membrane protein YpjD [Pseudolysobacter antarcticus]|uniref:Inner membrane protein YpjD n=1 Tax=Pseudolysobacter antarcticus TaxID=2511995 RepID=A0A411HI14_9GAMM|nr:cytochrome c biogenesis protein CcsA [Pseudolysobacter antarcticus]QBB70040.1 inner membrane protein YpjD [Pseudolysobacter antarcticus]